MTRPAPLSRSAATASRPIGPAPTISRVESATFDRRPIACRATADAHAKNYSLLLSAGQVRLAPLYDVASALPYGVDEHKPRLAMKVGRSYAVYPRHDSWPAAAEAFDLDAEALHARVQELAEVAPDAFSAAAATPEVKAFASDLPARLVDLIADRARRCLELLDRGTADSPDPG
jgi:serine/threonine-protein kinase HipA